MFAIGLCIDTAYLLPSLVTLISVADATPGRASTAIRVLTPDLSRADAAMMAAAVRFLGFRSFDLRWVRPAWRTVNGSYISTATYLRFDFDAGFVDRPHLVYLDSDVLVLGDLTSPLGTLSRGRIGLVRDLFNHTVGTGPALPGVADRWPAFEGRPYFNAGAMWCHTEMLGRLHTDVARIMRHDGQHIHYNDQDALNLWSLRHDSVQPLAPEFNTFEVDRFAELGDWVHPILAATPVPSSPVVLHFVGAEKPWLAICPSTPAVGLYRQYLRHARRLARW